MSAASGCTSVHMTHSGREQLQHDGNRCGCSAEQAFLGVFSDFAYAGPGRIVYLYFRLSRPDAILLVVADRFRSFLRTLAW